MSEHHTNKPRAARGVDPIKAGQEGVGFLVMQASRAFQQRMHRDVRQYNIQIPGYIVLRHLVREIDASPEGVTADELSRKLLLEKSDIEAAAVRLERDGWLKYVGSRPEVRLRPTPKAFKINPVLNASSRWMLEEALNGFSREEIEQLTGLLRRVLKNMDAPLGADEGPLQT